MFDTYLPDLWAQITFCYRLTDWQMDWQTDISISWADFAAEKKYITLVTEPSYFVLFCSMSSGVHCSRWGETEAIYTAENIILCYPGCSGLLHFSGIFVLERFSLNEVIVLSCKYKYCYLRQILANQTTSVKAWNILRVPGQRSR